MRVINVAKLKYISIVAIREDPCPLNPSFAIILS